METEGATASEVCGLAMLAQPRSMSPQMYFETSPFICKWMVRIIWTTDIESSLMFAELTISPAVPFALRGKCCR